MALRTVMPILAACLWPEGSACAAPAEFAIDPVHTRVLVEVDHAGFSRALGTASGATGTLRFDEGWAEAHVDVRVPLRRLDFGDTRWNRAVHDLLGTEQHADARFVSTRITPRDAKRAGVCGELTLNGVTHPLCIDATFNALARHPMPPFRRTAGFSGSARLDRTAFGLDRWTSMVGREVVLRIEVEASRGIGAPGATPPAPNGTPAR